MSGLSERERERLAEVLATTLVCASHGAKVGRSSMPIRIEDVLMLVELAEQGLAALDRATLDRSASEAGEGAGERMCGCPSRCGMTWDAAVREVMQTTMLNRDQAEVIVPVAEPTQ